MMRVKSAGSEAHMSHTDSAFLTRLGYSSGSAKYNFGLVAHMRCRLVPVLALLLAPRSASALQDNAPPTLSLILIQCQHEQV